MAVTKIINKQFPYAGALAQLNYENGEQLGMGDLGDLYTLSEENDNNEDYILDYPSSDTDGVNWMYEDSSIEVIGCNISNTGVNYDVSSARFAVYLVDDRYNDAIIDTTSGNGIRDDVLGTGNDFDASAGSDYILYYKSRGTIGSGGGIGEITNGTNGGNNRMKVSDIPGVPHEDNDGTTFVGIYPDVSQWSDDMSPNSDMALYIIVRMGGNADDYGSDDQRNRSYVKYKLPKRLLREMWLEGRNYQNSHDGGAYEIFAWGKNVGDAVGSDGEVVTTKIGNNPGYVTDNYGEGDESWPSNDVTAAAFKTTYLAVKVIPPQWNINDIPTNLPEYEDPNPEFGTRAWSWIKNTDDNNHIFLRPDNMIDYANLFTDDEELLQPIDIFDYRPISFVTVTSPGGDIDLQSWYDFGTDGFLFGSAPNIVRLSFDITENIKSSTFTIDYFSYDVDNNSWIISPTLTSPANMGIKFFVIDWNADNEEIVWDDILNSLPTNHTELFNQRQMNDTYFYENLVDEDGSYNYLEHEYGSAGMKIIKALVFSYIKHSEDGDYIQALRWKAVSIRINLNYDTNILEDFAEIGGFDFTYIPWPMTTPVVGGISNESGYVNSVENILSENKFNDNEMTDYYRTLTAFNNKPGGQLDEMGDYFGKSDIAQVRYFNSGSYDMNNLLGVKNYVSGSNGNYYGYDDFSYWKGDPCVHGPQYSCTELPTYPLDSSVGTIFINDINRQDLRDNCSIELNIDEIDDNLITDSNGNDIKGILIGDYNLKKDDYGESISRNSSPVVSEIDNADGAF